MIDNQLKVSVNTDDPAMFGATITEEFLHLNNQVGITLNEIKWLTKNAMESAFVSDEIKKKLKQKIDIFWDEQD